MTFNSQEEIDALVECRTFQQCFEYANALDAFFNHPFGQTPFQAKAIQIMTQNFTYAGINTSEIVNYIDPVFADAYYKWDDFLNIKKLLSNSKKILTAVNTARAKSVFKSIDKQIIDFETFLKEYNGTVKVYQEAKKYTTENQTIGYIRAYMATQLWGNVKGSRIARYFDKDGVTLFLSPVVTTFAAPEKYKAFLQAFGKWMDEYGNLSGLEISAKYENADAFFAELAPLLIPEGQDITVAADPFANMKKELKEILFELVEKMLQKNIDFKVYGIAPSVPGDTTRQWFQRFNQEGDGPSNGYITPFLIYPTYRIEKTEFVGANTSPYSEKYYADGIYLPEGSEGELEVEVLKRGEQSKLWPYMSPTAGGYNAIVTNVSSAVINIQTRVLNKKLEFIGISGSASTFSNPQNIGLPYRQLMTGVNFGSDAYGKLLLDSSTYREIKIATGTFNEEIGEALGQGKLGIITSTTDRNPEGISESFNNLVYDPDVLYWLKEYAEGRINLNELYDNLNIVLEDQEKSQKYAGTKTEDQIKKEAQDDNSVALPGSQPATNALVTNMFSMYSPTESEISALGREMWSNEVIDTLRKIWNDPMDGVISLHQMPLAPAITKRDNCTLGNYKSGVVMDVVGQQFKQYGLGSFTIRPKYNNFLDYYPYTKIKCFLPYIGWVDLDTNVCMNKTISIYYTVDFLSGTFIAQLTMNDDTGADRIYMQWEGVMGSEIPFTSSNFGRTVQSVVNLAASTVFETPTASTIVEGINTVFSERTNVQIGGKITGNAGQLTSGDTYIYIERPVCNYSTSDARINGYRVNKAGKISDFSGFCTFGNVDLDIKQAYGSEKDEILQLLESGVYI